MLFSPAFALDVAGGWMFLIAFGVPILLILAVIALIVIAIWLIRHAKNK